MSALQAVSALSLSPLPMQPRLAPETASANREVLAFRLGQELYGIPILNVQEIRNYEVPTRIAGAPESVRGVLNLRGVIVPVIDLRLRFGIEAKFDAATVTVVLNLDGRVVGAVVDSVSDVLDIAGGDIKPAPQFNSAVGAQHITGLSCIKQGEQESLIILLDIEGLMGAAPVLEAAELCA